MRTVQEIQPGDRFRWDGICWTATAPAVLEPNADGGDPIFAVVTACADGSDRKVSMAFYRADTLPEPVESQIPA